MSWLTYAFRLMYLPIGLFGVSIATAVLPAVSRHAAVDDAAAIRDTVSRGLALMLMLNVPATVGLIVAGDADRAAAVRTRPVPAGRHRGDGRGAAVLCASAWSATRPRGSPRRRSTRCGRAACRSMVSVAAIAVNVVAERRAGRARWASAGWRSARRWRRSSTAALLVLLLRRRLGGSTAGGSRSTFVKIVAAVGRRWRVAAVAMQRAHGATWLPRLETLLAQVGCGSGASIGARAGGRWQSHAQSCCAIAEFDDAPMASRSWLQVRKLLKPAETRGGTPPCRPVSTIRNSRHAPLSFPYASSFSFGPGPISTALKALIGANVVMFLARARSRSRD